jgi:hypothetical protein
MPPIDDPAACRARAGELRRLAGLIEHSTVHELRRLGGDATWRGPTADAFVADARAAARLLDEAAADLRHAARGLELRAADVS